SLLSATPPPPLSSLSLHDALPICPAEIGEELRPATERQRVQPLARGQVAQRDVGAQRGAHRRRVERLNACRKPARHSFDRRRLQDRKSTRLNSSHVKISYAVFCLK